MAWPGKTSIVLRKTLASVINPMVPLQAALRLSRVVGGTASVIEFAMGKMFLNPRVPRPLLGYWPDADDIFIATFAKSGTNWAMQTALQIAWRGRAEFDHIHHKVPWPEVPMTDVVTMEESDRDRSPTGRRIIKTHLSSRSVPYTKRAKYITVLRDPKEVIVSAYYFLLGSMGVLDVVSFQEWYDRFANDGPMTRAWAEHAASFWAWRDRPNVLVLTFAEMKADLAGNVKRFADLMEVSLSDAELAEVTRRASFSYMKEHESQFAPPKFPLRGNAPMAKMIRRGQAGGSNELLSRAQQAELDRQCQGLLRRLGSDLPYGELFDVVQG